jgi:sulfite reductase (NADPH) flavoprotein alpha-component
METGLADDQGEGGLEGAWEEWKPNLYNFVDAAPPPETLPPESHMLQVMTAVAAKEAGVEATTEYLPDGAKMTPLTKAELMTPVDYDRDIRHFEFDLEGLNMPYGMGDSLGIWPRNKKEDVDIALNYFGLFEDDVIQLEDVAHSRPKNPLPKSLTAKCLFEQVLDLFGKPKRRFYEMMATLAEDETEKADLQRLLSAEGKEDLNSMTKVETVNHMDVLRMFPKTRPSVAQLLDYVPDIRPRLYSIASATRLHGEDKLHLLIVADDWTTPNGVYKHGLCTQFLRALEATPEEPVTMCTRVNPAAVLYPEDLTVPLILSGLGTGLAPLRAALEERVAAKQEGEEVGPVALFFGSRHEKEEFPYGDEFKKYVEMGVLTKLCTAFSRDQAHKIYVQDRVKEEAAMIYDFLITQNGNFYYCGTGGSAVDQIQEAVEGAFVSEGGMTPQEAKDLVTDMRIKGRYNVESW